MRASETGVCGAREAARLFVCRVAMIALWIVVGFGGREAAAQDRARFLRWTYQDAGSMVREIGSHTPLLALGGAVVLVPTAQLDPSLLEEVQEGVGGPLDGYLDFTNELGSPRVTPVAAGIFAVSLVTADARFQDAAFTSLQSLLYAGAITTTLKAVAGRFRPEAGAGAYRFDPFSGNTSFPSGHTTAAFALLTPWVFYYPNAATYGLFALGAGTAVARIARDKHWPTDVLAGGAVGFLTARYLSRRHQRSQQERDRLAVAPVVAPDGVGIHLRLRLD